MPAATSHTTTAHAHETHESFIKTPKQLIIVVLLAFLVPILGIILMANMVNAGKRMGAGANAMTDEAIEQRIRPVAGFELKAAASAATARSGEEIFKSTCAACHAAGVAGAPKLGDAGAWAPRIKSGLDSLLHSALKGKGAMPAQGGGDASDLEVSRAVVYMANQGGGKFEEPKADAKPGEGKSADASGSAQGNGAAQVKGAAAAGSAGTSSAAASAQADTQKAAGQSAAAQSAGARSGGESQAPTGESPVGQVAPAAAAAGAAGGAGAARAADAGGDSKGGDSKDAGKAAAGGDAFAGADVDAGKALYDKTCTTCHTAGIAGAPKLGDKAAWEPRIAEGADAIMKIVINGKGGMPPKGLAMTASEADLKNAVAYMISKAK